MSRALIWEKQFLWEEIISCLCFKLIFEVIQTSTNCQVLNKKNWTGRQNCTLPVQINVLGGKRSAVFSNFLNLLGVELKSTEQLSACFSIGLSKLPYTFPEDQFGREVDSKNFFFDWKKRQKKCFQLLTENDLECLSN